MAEEPRKRSRFDQAEPDPPRKSRFDRRSRSPPRKDSEGGDARDRSPVAKSTEGGGAKKDAATAAAEAAARINAQLHNKKGPQHVDVPPIRSAQSPTAGDKSVKSPSQPGGAPLNAEVYQQDGDYIKDIEVNDLRNRYTLTKGSTQKMIKEETGADVTTRGNYYPNKELATAANPPLYLHVTSQTKDGLEKAVEKINELMQQDLPNLIDERRFRRPREPEQQVERDHLGRRKWPEERIPIDLEPIPGFNLRAQVVGAGGSYVKHIQGETHCRVQIKGRGSGFKESDTGVESDEQMYLHVAGPDPAEVERAKELCLSLLDNVKQSYAAHKERPPSYRGGSGYGGSGGNYGHDRGGYQGGPHDRNGSGSYGGGSSSYGNYGGGADPAASYTSQPGYNSYAQPQSAYAPAQSPATPHAADPNTPDPATAMAAWAQYYASNPSEDPYRDYGGYAAVMAQYGASQQQGTPQQQQGYGAYYQGQQGYAGSPVQGMNGVGAGAPPPPPPEDGGYAPPPPPPGSAGPPGAEGGGYAGVPPPPPPGM